jgi:hypothetical protein
MNKERSDLYGIVDIDDPDFETKLLNLAKEFGVVVIKNVMSEQECDTYTSQTISDLEKIGDVNRKDLTTWTLQNLPRQVRPGMFHEVVCNTPTVNQIRFDPNIIKIFRVFYSKIKNKNYEDTDLVVSNDGYNIKPGTIGPYDDGTDWAHVDQTTDLDKPYKCIQGQMVLSNTSACFRASPGSHRLFREIVEEYTDNIYKSHSDFLKFRAEQYIMLKKKIESVGGSWQIKIPANKGDFIIWASSVIHSATLQTKPEKTTRLDKWKGWRHVVYVCYRPRDEFTNKQLRDKYQWFLENRVTNHWGTYAFPSRSNRSTKMDDFSEKLRNFIKNPQSVYDIKGMNPELSEKEQLMMGKTEEDIENEDINDITKVKIVKKNKKINRKQIK